MASVLVVEDDQFVRSALIRHLTDAAHLVRSVGTALEALREVAHFRFDVVILDLGLPDLDGSEALKMLRGITDVPVIIATAPPGCPPSYAAPAPVPPSRRPPRCCASAVSPSTRCAARPNWTDCAWT